MSGASSEKSVSSGAGASGEKGAVVPESKPMRTDGEIPVARVRKARRFSLAWLIPMGALALVVAIVWAQVSKERGPLISIRFTDAAGLEPEARIVYRGLRVGVVRDVELSSDMSEVVVTAELTPSSAGIAREGTEFWIVQPEVSLQRVAGLETILGPRYLAVRPGAADAPRKRAFDGLERAPRLNPSAVDALTVELIATRAGALSAGAPVLYRDVPVGTVRGFVLAPDAESVLVRVEIDPAYAGLVREKTRFWYAGGVGVDWGLFRGLSVQAESLDALIEGAIAFATPRKPGERVEQGARFDLESAAPEGWTKWRPEIDWSAPDDAASPSGG